MRNDEKLLKKSEDVYELFGTSIIRVTDLIIYQDELMRETVYQPARLAGSSIQSKRVSQEQVRLLENTFQSSHNEKKLDFRQKIQRFLADPHTFEVNIVQNDEQPLALIVYSRENDKILDIPLLRVASGAFTSTLAIHLIHSAVTLCTKEGRVLTRFTEICLTDAVLKALQENR